MIWRSGANAFTTDDGEVREDDPEDPMRTAIRQMRGVFAGSSKLGGCATRSSCCELRARGPSTLAVLEAAGERNRERGDGTTILFGLPGVAVDRVERDVDGRPDGACATVDDAAAACPVCGVFSSSVQQRRTTRPRDLPYGEAPLLVRWHKTQFRCREQECSRKAFTESIAELPPCARVTGRRRAAAVGGRRGPVGVCGDGRELPMSWPVVHAAFVVHAERAAGRAAAPVVLGIDETRRGRPRWTRTRTAAGAGWSGSRPTSSTCPGRWAARPGRRPDLEERDRLARRPRPGVEGPGQGRGDRPVPPYRAAVQRVAARADRRRPVPSGAAGQQDGHRGPAARVPRATRPPRPRPVTRRGPTAGCCSAPVTGSPPGHRPPRRRLRRLRPDRGDRRCLGRKGTAPHAARHHRPAQQRRAALHRFHETVLAADLPEATRLAQTIDAWWPQILGFLETRHTNAGTEGTNHMIKDAGSRRIRLPQPRQPTPPSTVPLHPAITPENQCRGGRAPSTLRNRQGPRA